MQSGKRTKFRLALLLTLSSTTSLLADETFIVQPRLRVTIEPQAPPIQQPSKTSYQAVPSFAAPPRLGTRARTATDTRARTATERANVESRSPSFSPPRSPSFSQASSQSFPQAQTTYTGSTQELQWYTRGTAPRTAAQSAVRSVSTIDLRVDSELSRELDQSTAPSQRVQMSAPPRGEESISVEFPAEAETQPNALETNTVAKETEVDVQRRERKVLASMVSNRIIGPTATGHRDAPSHAMDTTPGWQAIGERLTRHIQNCEALLRRNAFFSAREEAESAAVYLVRVLDLMSNNYSSEPLLLAAQQALHESEDFTFSQRLTTDEKFLERLIESHQTGVLKEADVSQLSPLVAAQHYRQYATECLVQACQSHPWASEVYYMLGRTFQAQADERPSNSDGLRWRAVTYYQAAVAIAPSNSIASNQLGFILLQMDRAQDARAALVASVEANWNEPALENLVEASRRLNDAATQHWAMQNLTAMRQARPYQTPAPQVTEVDPRTFIALSPYSIGPQSPH